MAVAVPVAVPVVGVRADELDMRLEPTQVCLSPAMRQVQRERHRLRRVGGDHVEVELDPGESFAQLMKRGQPGNVSPYYRAPGKALILALVLDLGFPVDL